LIVHETDTGYAQCFRYDADNKNMGDINLKDIIFSQQIKSEWKNPKSLGYTPKRGEFSKSKIYLI